MGLLAGCGAGDQMSSAGGADGEVLSDQPAADGDIRAGGVEGAADSLAGTGSSGSGSVGTAGRVAVQTRAVISTGEVTLEAKDLTRVREDLDRLLGRFGGTVADERTSRERAAGPTRSRLVLRVPSPRFDDLMASFDDIATVTTTQREEVDVTTEVIDVDARVRTAEVSLRRLRAFLGRSTAVTSLIRLESEIAEREAELASLRAQQDYLADQTSLATITLLMQTSEAATEPEDPWGDAGFLTGLRDGWNALLGVLVVGATIVGALVPFALVLGLVLGPVLIWLRARRRTVASPPPAAPAA